MSFCILLQFVILICSISIHEFFHGWVACKLGDQTAKYAGRLSLNPLKHIDPIGTILLPFMLTLLHLPPIGWARPVPVNFSNLRNLKRDIFLVGIAGPSANFLAAVVLSLILKSLPATTQTLLVQIIIYGIVINMALAIFNLIPIPPLDGSRVITAILPWRYIRLYNSIEPYGFLIVIILLWSGIIRNTMYILVLLIIKLLGININLF